jgi:hypothetical protein
MTNTIIIIIIIIMKVNSLCLINLSPCHEDIYGSGGIAPPFLTGCTGWR